jgi:hypothetical protein
VHIEKRRKLHQAEVVLRRKRHDDAIALKHLKSYEFQLQPDQSEIGLREILVKDLAFVGLSVGEPTVKSEFVRTARLITNGKLL